MIIVVPVPRLISGLHVKLLVGLTARRVLREGNLSGGWNWSEARERSRAWSFVLARRNAGDRRGPEDGKGRGADRDCGDRRQTAAAPPKIRRGKADRKRVV